jgi:NADH:ubiquinone oxidoreductase subunit 3 (subunit A)
MIVERYLFIGALLLFAVVFGAGMLLAVRVLAPRRGSATKGQTYECGMVTRGDSWVRFRLQYYIFALMFVVFDIEAVFLFPWAVAYLGLGWFALIEMAVFVLLLAAVLVYAWAAGALRWS